MNQNGSVGSRRKLRSRKAKPVQMWSGQIAVDSPGPVSALAEGVRSRVLELKKELLGLATKFKGDAQRFREDVERIFNLDNLKAVSATLTEWLSKLRGDYPSTIDTSIDWYNCEVAHISRV